MTRTASGSGESRAAVLPLLGGHLALDFVNTVDWRLRAVPEEHLVSYATLVGWAVHAGVVEPAEASALRAGAVAEPAVAAATLSLTLELREAVYRLFLAEARGVAPDADDLAILNRVLLRFPRRGAVVRAGAAYGWKTVAPAEPLVRPVERVAQAVSALLLAPELARIRLCEGEGCGWLFLDVSPNRRRRWCSMEGCGNRAKARRHHARGRNGKAELPT